MIESLGVSIWNAGIFEVLGHPLLWFTTVSLAAPLALAATGGALSERTGIVNIGLEGLMLVGAFFSALVDELVFQSLHWNAAWAALLAIVGGVGAAATLAAIFAAGAIQFRANQIIAGMALNVLALGLTSFLFASVFGLTGTSGNLPGIPNIHIAAFALGPVHFGSLSRLSWLSLGYVLFQQNPIVYVAVAAAVVFQVVLFRTTIGLRLRSSGENPAAAEASGVSVAPLRYLAVIASGALCGLGGCMLVLNQSPAIFTDNITQGRGFIALAAVIIGRWTPLGAFGACLIFAFGEALSQDIGQPSIGSFQLTSYLLGMLPYLIAVTCAVGLSSRSRSPAAAGHAAGRDDLV